MPTPSPWLCLAVFVSTLTAGCHPHIGPLPCDTPGLSGSCGAGCLTDSDCGRGYHCDGALTCATECLTDGTGCERVQVCSDRGYCVDAGGYDAAGPFFGDLSNQCPRVVAQLTGVRPTVELLIDRSGSMNEIDSGNSKSRWSLVRYALTDVTAGVVHQLQANVYFGVALFSSYTTCPEITPRFDSGPIKPALDNANAVEYLFNKYLPRGATPTAASIRAAADYLHGLPPNPEGPSIILLATDGQPNACGDPTQADDTAATAAAAAYAFGLGIEVYVLGVGPETSDANLQAVANAGRGVASGAKFYRGTLPSELVAAFNEIVISKRSCTLTLSGKLSAADAPSGDLELDGQKLGYGDANGWHQTSPTTIELDGTACARYLEKDPALSATFPCGTLIL